MLVQFKGNNNRIMLIESISVIAITEDSDSRTAIYLKDHMTAFVVNEPIPTVLSKLGLVPEVRTATIPSVSIDEIRKDMSESKPFTPHPRRPGISRK